MRHSPSESEVKLSFIWDRIVKPVVDALKLTPAVGRARPRLVWCPTGDFSFLPLHAAGYYKGANPQCCSDFVVSSYTPTIAALLRAQANSQIPSVSMLKILLVGEAMSSSLDLPPLHNVKTELDLISTIAHRAHVSVESIGEGNADILHVTGKLETAHLVHLACHGIQDLEDALTSGFCLRDGSLTISRLMELKLDTSFLAFLSACETAHGNEAQPDEVVHLAAAMLFAGFRSIVATMWYVFPVQTGHAR
jgi:CHAT domain-containing protein